MSLELKKEYIKTGRRLKEASCEQKLDMEITLPDYCADIKKILRCTLTPGIHTVSLSGERASAKGTGTVRVIYLAEGDKIDVYEKSCELSSAAVLKDISPDMTVTAEAVADFVNCRALSQRKINVNSGISTIYSCFAAVQQQYAVNDEKNIIQAKKEKISCESCLGFFEKTFDLAETVALNSEHPAVGKIISCSCRIVNESHKLSQGKLLIKGDAVTDICYLTESGKNELHSISHSMPISQIADLRQVPDSAFCRIRLKACQQLCSVKADSSGNNRLVDISLRISAFTEAYEKTEREVITDCYCTRYETEESFVKPELICPVREMNEARQIKGEIELSSPAKEICFVRCTEISKSIRCDEDEAHFDCSALLFIMYLDENGVPCCQEKNLDFDFSYSLVKKCTAPFAFFTVECIDIPTARVKGDKVEITLNFNVSGNVYSNYEGRILKELIAYEDKPKQNKSAPLTVYFADKGEHLWDIAREHNSTTELIMKENALKNNIIDEKLMLMIPCV